MQTLDEKRADQAALQLAINAAYADQGVQAAFESIRQAAYAEHADHRQYDGYWDGPEWTLAKVTTPIRSKGGLQADVGDVVIYRSSGWAGTFHAEFYSVRLGWMCSVGYGVLPITSRYTGQRVERDLNT